LLVGGEKGKAITWVDSCETKRRDKREQTSLPQAFCKCKGEGGGETEEAAKKKGGKHVL